MTSISVIIPSRNEGARVLKTVRSLVAGRSKPFPLEVVVVDDASTDGSCDRLADTIGPVENFCFIVRRLERWSGIPFARNRGAEAATYPILVMTDANTSYPQDWDLEIWSHIHPSRVLAGTIVDEATGQRGYGLSLELPSMGVKWLPGTHAFGGYVPIAPCTCTVIQRDLFQRLGAYDETLPLYGAAEPEFSVRAWLSGCEIVSIPELLINHRFRPLRELSQFQHTNSQLLSCNSLRFACSYLPNLLLQTVFSHYFLVMGDQFELCITQLQNEGVWERRKQLAQALPFDFAWFARRFGLSDCEPQASAISDVAPHSTAWVPITDQDNLARTLVIIPAFRQHHLTAALVQDCVREGVGILVVDNSGDYPQSKSEHVIRPGINLGWLRANNLAIEGALQSGWERVVLLNNDLRLSHHFFAGLVWTETHSGASIVSASYDGHWKVQRPEQLRKEKDLPAVKFKLKPCFVPYGACDGTCVSIHRRVFERIGLLDNEHFGRFGWAAVTDLCFRARDAGMMTAISRASFANHLDGGRKTARDVIGLDYERLAEAEGAQGMVKKWGSTWRESRPTPTTTPCVVYTTITGNRDTLKEPAFMPPGWKFVCFTDSPSIRSRNWEIRPIVWSSPDGDPRRTARWHKINTHLLFPEETNSIWSDASVRVTGDWRQLHWFLGSFGLASYQHYMRDCLYSEARECIRLGLDDPTLIRGQVERYRAEGYPAHNGLFETSVLLRRHTEPVMVRFADLWWNEVHNGSKRDQISVNYVAWRLNMQCGIIRDTLRSSDWLVRDRNAGA